MLKILLSESFFNKTISIFKKLKYIVVNTEKLQDKIIHNIIRNCPELRLMFYYGLTEASRTCFITLSDVNEKHYSSVGKPTSDDITVKIINDEIYIAGNHLFSGYINDTSDNKENGFLKLVI